MNAEHPHRNKFLVDLSQAIFMQHQEDLAALIKARAGMLLSLASLLFIYFLNLLLLLLLFLVSCHLLCPPHFLSLASAAKLNGPPTRMERVKFIRRMWLIQRLWPVTLKCQQRGMYKCICYTSLFKPIVYKCILHV